MNTPSSITLTTAAQLRTHDTTLAASTAVLAEIKATCAKISPEALCFVAADASVEHEKIFADALAELRDEVLAPLAMLAHLSTELAASFAAAEEALRPTMYAVAVRRLAIDKRLAEIPHSVALKKSAVESAHARYIAAGLRNDEVERLIQPQRDQAEAGIEALDAEEAALRAELDALKRFHTTHNPNDLPEGFEIPAPVETVSFRHAV
ncbi:hypothetical protein [Zoogloea sp.]|uniref:hypothetical protein n=1 Tax=Zoogloea sp. TaxID=49181 RepID=UPI0035AD81AE